MWILPLYLHVNHQKSDDDDDDGCTPEGYNVAAEMYVIKKCSTACMYDLIFQISYNHSV